MFAFNQTPAAGGSSAAAGRAAALGFALVANHAFVDGNKRIGHAAIEVFLLLNGFEIIAAVDEQERVVLRVASGELDRADLVRWLETTVVRIP